MSKNVKLKDLAYINMGQSPKSTYYTEDSSYIPFLQGNRTFGHKYPSFDTYVTKPIKTASKGSVLMSVRAPVGDLNIANSDLCIGRGVAELKSKTDENEYLYYVLLANKHRLTRSGNGSIFNSIGIRELSNMKLIVPAQDNKNKFINTLKTLDDKIEKNNHLYASIEEYAKVLFYKWFVNYNFPTENTQAYKDNGGEMKKVNKKLIPLNWRRGTFKDLMTVKSGKRSNKISEKPTEKDVVPVYGASEIIGYTDETLYDEQVIITGRVGTHGVLMREKDKSWPSDNTLVVFPEFYEFTYQLLKTLNFSNLNIGSTQPLITQSNLLKQKCILPPREVLEKFESVVTPLMRKADLIHEENKKLIEISNLFIHKLLK